MLSSWTLAIDGLVRRPRSYTLADLKRYPRREVQSFHNCVGSPLALHVPTLRIANVVWGGVDLKTLLDEAGVEGTATYLLSYGLDYGIFQDIDNDSYVKDMPLDRVEAGDVLVAYELNGEPLPAEHGFPARLFVPGWYGTNSVKWLHRMTLADRRAEGLFTTTLYNDVLPSSAGDGESRTRPTWAVAPDSLIVAPAPDDYLRVGQTVGIWGWAWAAAGIRSVDVNVDGGRTWQAAAVQTRDQWSWQRFSLPWRPAKIGPVSIASRAADVDGAIQPPAGARNEVHTVAITVSA